MGFKLEGVVGLAYRRARFTLQEIRKAIDEFGRNMANLGPCSLLPQKNYL